MKLYIQPIPAMSEDEVRALCDRFGAVEAFSPAGKGVFVTLDTDWDFDRLASDAFDEDVIVLPGELRHNLPDKLPKPLHEFALKVANELGEKGKPSAAIIRMIKLCGPVFVEAMFIMTRDIEENGGLLTDDGSRRRTPGGVFFKLAKGHMYPGMRSAVRGRPEVEEKDA